MTDESSTEIPRSRTILEMKSELEDSKNRLFNSGLEYVQAELEARDAFDRSVGAELLQDAGRSIGGRFESGGHSVHIGHVHKRVAEASIAAQPESKAPGGVGGRAYRCMSQNISVLGCSLDERDGILEFMKVNADLLASAGCEALCCVFDEFEPAIEAGRGSVERRADVVVTVQKTGKEPEKDELDLLELGHRPANGLPKGFAALFAEAVYVLSHAREAEELSGLSQWEEPWESDEVSP